MGTVTRVLCRNEVPGKQIPVEILGSYVNMKQILVMQVSEEV